MKIIYFGTPFFAADILTYLLSQGVEVVAVVTQPDRPKGRSSQLTPSPVKIVTPSDIPIFQPEKASNESFLSELRRINADLYVVVAFGQILPQKLLDTPPLGCINVHASLLPKYRGAAPIQRSILAGDLETGIAIQKMVKQLDAGDVIAVAKTEIPFDMTYGELETKLKELAKPLLLQVIHEYEQRIPEARSQDPALVTFAPKIEPEEGEIHWTKPARDLHNLVRAFSPRPGAWVWVQVGEEKKRLKVLRTQVVESKGMPGELLSDAIVATGEGALKLIDVQPEGKKVMKGADWLRGQKKISFLDF